MTEMEQLLEWLVRVKLPYSTWNYGVAQIICLGDDRHHHMIAGIAGTQTNYKEHDGDDTLLDGYRGFFHTFVFDEHETLIESGSWE